MYVNVNLLKTIDEDVIEYCKVVYIFSKSFCQLYLQLVAYCGSYRGIQLLKCGRNGCRFFSAREGVQEKCCQSWWARKSYTRDPGERERCIYIQNRMNCIRDCTSFFSISSSSMYQIPIALHFNSLSVCERCENFCERCRGSKSSVCLGDHTLWILLDSCLVLIE